MPRYIIIDGGFFFRENYYIIELNYYRYEVVHLVRDFWYLCVSEEWVFKIEYLFVYISYFSLIFSLKYKTFFTVWHTQLAGLNETEREGPFTRQ
jgi:hypothetical protein